MRVKHIWLRSPEMIFQIQWLNIKSYAVSLFYNTCLYTLKSYCAVNTLGLYTNLLLFIVARCGSNSTDCCRDIHLNARDAPSTRIEFYLSNGTLKDLMMDTDSIQLYHSTVSFCLKLCVNWITLSHILFYKYL